VPIQTRCPSCAAAVPANAAWCSLCHADLRHRDEPLTSAVDDLADQPEDDLPVERELESAGRHAVGAPVPRDRAVSSGGRHAAGRRTAARSTRASAPTRRATADPYLGTAALPADGDPTPEQVDAFAEAMLRRLADSEKGPSVLDPDELPGGRWGFTAGLTAAFIVALIAVGTVLGFLLSR
jgi:hypothetical protein